MSLQCDSAAIHLTNFPWQFWALNPTEEINSACAHTHTHKNLLVTWINKPPKQAMDSLTEKIVQLLVSHSAFRVLEVCESEGDWRENTEIQSFQFYSPFTVALFPFSASVRQWFSIRSHDKSRVGKCWIAAVTCWCTVFTALTLTN